MSDSDDELRWERECHHTYTYTDTDTDTVADTDANRGMGTMLDMDPITDQNTGTSTDTHEFDWSLLDSNFLPLDPIAEDYILEMGPECADADILTNANNAEAATHVSEATDEELALEAARTQEAFLSLIDTLNMPSFEEQQTAVVARRGARRISNKKRAALAAALRATTAHAPLPISDERTLVSLLERPPISEKCLEVTDTFVRDAEASSLAMDLLADSSWNKTTPTFVSRLLVSTMTLGVNMGARAPFLISEALANAAEADGKGCSARERLANMLLAPAARAFALQLFGRALAITQAEKDAMRNFYKQARRVKPQAGLDATAGNGDGQGRGKKRGRGQASVGEDASRASEEDAVKEDQHLFANAVIIMIPDATAANIKSCKVFTSGALHITGCLTLDEGLKIAGAVGRVVRVALGLPDIGPHPVEKLDVQMINTDFAIGMCIDRLSLEETVNSNLQHRVPPPCWAEIPESKHASIKLLMADMKFGTVLVFTTGKIMMTGFKNWLDLRRAFQYTVEVITENSDRVRSNARKQGGSSSQTNRRRNNKAVGEFSPIMRLVPPLHMTVDADIDADVDADDRLFD